MAHGMAGFFGTVPHPPPPVLASFQDEQAVAEDVHDVEAGDGGGGQGKLCARGHWRPAEDDRLKELVAQHGPQNWNVIAEKLDGRSGEQRNAITWRGLFVRAFLRSVACGSCC
jgi:transcription factor MYB, plant